MPEWSVDIYNIRKKVTDANGRIVWSDLRKIPLFPQNKNSVIVDELSVYRIIKDKQYRENIGIVNISANPRLFSQYLATLKSVSEQLGVMLPEEDYDTFGGFVFGILGFIPEDGSTPELEGYGLIIKVIEIKEHQLEKAVVCLESTSGSAAEPSEA
jgi:Mg2+/Co2+ transporter CorC